MVLRVSRTLQCVPEMAETHREVSVAIPLRCPTKLRAVRSARRIARVLPETVRRTSPAEIASPSLFFTVISESPTASRTAFTISIPARTPPLRAVKSAVLIESAAIVEREVTSSPPCKSSASAIAMRSLSIIDHSHPDIQLSIHRSDRAAE